MRETQIVIMPTYLVQVGQDQGTGRLISNKLVAIKYRDKFYGFRSVFNVII
jgi:hypothetical protein